MENMADLLKYMQGRVRKSNTSLISISEGEQRQWRQKKMKKYLNKASINIYQTKQI